MNTKKSKVSKNIRRGNGVELVSGKGAYVVLCYAKFKKGYFTADDYRNFQLNRQSMLHSTHRTFRSLVEWGYMESAIIEDTKHYRITMEGDFALAMVAERQKKKMEAMQRENGLAGNAARRAPAGDL
jgi:hypothetical protein